jgi:putative Ca2+/H+ antiporter (TMEM165/GDT1 family)
MISLIFSTFAIIFLAELPDKTALASLALATRYRARDVVAGAWLAFVVQTIVAVLAGSVIHLLPAKPVHIASGIGFLVFAVLALRRDEEEEEEEEEAAAAAQSRRGLPSWVACFLVVFAAEWGDLTQLGTAALVARYGRPLPIAIGAIGGEWAVALLAALTGSQLSRFLTPVVLNRAGAALFTVVGIFVIATAFIG